MAAKVFAANYDAFGEMLASTFIGVLQQLLDSHKQQDIECGLSTLFILLKEKRVLKIIQDKPDLLRSWLKYGKSTSGEIKVAFLISLESLLERKDAIADEFAHTIYRLCSHVTTPDYCMTEGESLKRTLLYLTSILVTPFPEQQIAALRVLQSTFS